MATTPNDPATAPRRRLPMVEFDGTVEVTDPDGPVPFLDLFQGRDEGATPSPGTR